jgi:toxin CptA
VKSAPTIAFDYRPSRGIAIAATVVVMAAVMAPWFTGLHWSVALALSTAALIIGMAALKRFTHTAFRRIAYQASGWKLVDADEVEYAVDLMAHTRLGIWLVLDFRQARDHRFRAVLGPDNVDAETRRRLILLLARAEVAQAG